MTVTVNNSISEQEATALLSELAQVESLDALVLSGHNRRTPRMALGLDAVPTTQRQKVDRHLFADWRARKQSVVDHLKALPKRGEVLHAITGGDYNGTDILPAVLDMAGARKAVECYITTLGFSDNNVRLLGSMVEGGQIDKLAIVASYYFARASKAIYQTAERELVPRGVRLMHCRCHAKTILLKLDTGHHYVIETSANLRSCVCAEALTLTEDAALYRFYRRFIEHLFTQQGATA